MLVYTDFLGYVLKELSDEYYFPSLFSASVSAAFYLFLHFI